MYVHRFIYNVFICISNLKKPAGGAFKKTGAFDRGGLLVREGGRRVAFKKPGGI